MLVLAPVVLAQIDGRTAIVWSEEFGETIRAQWVLSVEAGNKITAGQDSLELPDGRSFRRTRNRRSLALHVYHMDTEHDRAIKHWLLCQVMATLLVTTAEETLPHR